MLQTLLANVMNFFTRGPNSQTIESITAPMRKIVTELEDFAHGRSMLSASHMGDHCDLLDAAASAKVESELATAQADNAIALAASYKKLIPAS